MAALTYAQVSQILKYDPETGKLFWLPRPTELFSDGKPGPTKAYTAAKWNARYSGKEAFTYTTPYGYKCGQVYHYPYLAHLVIWCLTHGEWPERQIDHINGDRSDNRIKNLRLVTDAENKLNQKRHKDNKSGVMGVCWDKRLQKWHAYINKDRKRTNLGWFCSKEEAVRVRLRAEESFGFHPNHGR